MINGQVARPDSASGTRARNRPEAVRTNKLPGFHALTPSPKQLGDAWKGKKEVPREGLGTELPSTYSEGGGLVLAHTTDLRRPFLCQPCPARQLLSASETPRERRVTVGLSPLNLLGEAEKTQGAGETANSPCCLHSCMWPGVAAGEGQDVTSAPAHGPFHPQESPGAVSLRVVRLLHEGSTRPPQGCAACKFRGSLLNLLQPFKASMVLV